MYDFNDNVIKKTKKQDEKRLGSKNILEMSLLGGLSSVNNRILVQKDKIMRI